MLFERDEPISASTPARSGKKKNDGQVCIYYRYLFDYCVGNFTLASVCNFISPFSHYLCDYILGS